MTTSLPTSIPDTQLGLSAAEIQILRQHQAIALQTHSSASSVRGRGHARNSSSSRGTSAASSGQGRLMLDPGSLSALGQHFDRLMLAIQGRVDAVSRAGPCTSTLGSLLPVSLRTLWFFRHLSTLALFSGARFPVQVHPNTSHCRMSATVSHEKLADVLGDCSSPNRRKYPSPHNPHAPVMPWQLRRPSAHASERLYGRSMRWKSSSTKCDILEILSRVLEAGWKGSTGRWIEVGGGDGKSRGGITSNGSRSNTY